MEYNGFRKRRKSMGGYFVTAVIGAMLGSALMLMFAPGFLLSRISNLTSTQAKVQNVGTVQKQAVTNSNTDGNRLTDIGYAANKVMPAVVGILRPIKQKAATGNQEVQTVEIGTGVIVDAGGYVLTNNHVADASKELDISLYDGRHVRGRVVWTDPVLDISIVKINNTGLHHATLGDSTTVRIGDGAIAIGNPLGLKFQRSVTSGIISALNRTVQMPDGIYMEDLIQTDASINPGNSGGPLINVKGEVVGINTVKVATAEGMGFAIPINMAKPIIESFKKTGSFRTPALGIEGVDLAMAEYFEHKVKRGVYVSKVLDGSPADQAGIIPGDSIVAINGKTISTLMDLKEAIFSIGSGGTAILTVESTSGAIRDARAVLEEI